MRITSLLMLVILSSCQPESKSDTGRKLPDLTKELESLMDRHELMGLSLILIEKGKVVYENALGTANLRTSQMLNLDSKFRIASISKLVTTMALMQLEEQGKVDLDSNVSAYLGWELRNPYKPQAIISLRNLMSHQSSIRDGQGYGEFLAQMHPGKLHIKELFQEQGSFYSEDMFASELPGSTFSYANSAWGLVATVIETVSGTSFDQYCKQHIFKPLGLTASFNVSQVNLEDLAALYRWSEDHWQAQVDDYPEPPINRTYPGYQPGTNGLIHAPQGGLRASVKELAAIAKLLINGGSMDTTRILTSQSVVAMMTPNWEYNGSNGDTWNQFFLSYGLGTHILTNSDSADVIFPEHHMVGHAGIAYGLLSDMYLDPTTGMAVVFVTNGSKNSFEYGDSSSFYQVEQDVFRICHLYLKDSILSPNYP